MWTMGVRGTGGKREGEAGGKELRCLVGSFGVSPYQMVRQSIGEREMKKKGRRWGTEGTRSERRRVLDGW